MRPQLSASAYGAAVEQAVVDVELGLAGAGEFFSFSGSSLISVPVSVGPFLHANCVSTHVGVGIAAGPQNPNSF